MFGDTINVASRIETTGVVNQIQCSQATADLLPQNWLRPREDLVHAKGKGSLRTYFVTVGSTTTGKSPTGGSHDESVTDYGCTPEEKEDIDQLDKMLNKRLQRNASPLRRTRND